MELAGLFLLVLLPPADATGTTAAAVTESLRHELGDVTLAIAPDTVVTPAMWQGEKASLRAHFVVHVAWKKKDTASIELFSPASAKDAAGFRNSRDLAFSPQDSKTERGRAIGLVVAELLRESPASALATVQTIAGKPASGPEPPSRLVLGGMFVGERVRSGNWAMGPELTYDFGLGEAVRLRAAGAVLFGSADQYTAIEVDAGIFWDFVRSERGRHALGIGFEVGLLRESAAGSAEYGSSPSAWNLALGPSLGGRLTVWRGLRLVGAVGLRTTSGTFSVTVGDDSHRTQQSFSRWRPSFALGLEFAL